jgi:spore maturation protein CgeB
MHLVIFGLTLSSSWGNGHATLWRGLLKALAARGHSAVFFERDMPYYRGARDGWTPPVGVSLRLYEDIDGIKAEIKRELSQADAAFVTSFCPDGVAASRLVLDSHAAKVFYDLDTPVTLDALDSCVPVPYLPVEGLGEFDLVLSYTGGRALERLQERLGARRVAPLYGWVDPDVHTPAHRVADFRAELSYLGTFAADRQVALDELFLQPARQNPQGRFVIGGAQYPDDFPWLANIHFVRHLPPELHSAFFGSCRATLNITRRAMADYGYCPSGRLFEAAACGAVILTDTWVGLQEFFTLGSEVIAVSTTADVLAALSLSDAELSRIAQAARLRTLEQHAAAARALELEKLFETILSPPTPTAATLA